jgi:hypothetical protein
MQNRLNLAGAQQILPQRRQHAPRGSAKAYFRIGRMGDSHRRRQSRPPDQIGFGFRGNIRRVGALDPGSRTNGVNRREIFVAKRFRDDRAFAAFRRRDHADPVRAGHGPA